MTFSDRRFFAGRFQGLRGEDLFTWIPEGRSAGFGLPPLLQRGITELAAADMGGDGLLYHYTSVDAFETILASGELWLSDYRSLNDAAEIRYGRTVAHRAFDALQTAPPVREMLMATVERDCTEAFFVTSFTWAGDELSQWRAYGDSAHGVALGFEPLEFVALLGLDPQGINLSRVTYAPAEQERLFAFVGSIADQAWLLDASRGLNEPELLRRHVQRAVLERFPLCKDPAFADERECRLVVVPALTLSGHLDALETRVRPNGSLYTTTRLLQPEFDLPLRAVVTGPSAGDVAIARAVALASHLGVPVARSRVPLRR